MRATLRAIAQRFIELDKLLSLRGLAALAVVVYHTQNYLRENLDRNVEILSLDMTWLFTPEGKMPVIIFFTLSGYLMFKAFVAGRYKLNQAGVIRFYKSRARRILPLYYFLVFLFLIFVTPKLFLSNEGLQTIRDVVTFNYNGFGDFVSPFWSLSVEVQFYLIVPLLAYIILRYLKTNLHRGICLILVTLAIIAARAIIFSHETPASLTATGQLIASLDAFLIGGFTALVVDHYKHASWVSRHKRTLIIASFVIGIGIIPFSSLYYFKFYDLGFDQLGITIVALLTCLFIFASELTTKKGYTKRHYTLKQLLRHPWLLPEFVGALSYGIYLWHAPIIGQMHIIPINNHGDIKESFIRATIVILISSILSYLTYKYIELYQAPKHTADQPSQLP